MQYISHTALSLFCLSFFFVAGCSDGRLKTEPVSGVVTFDGVPLAEASIGFAPKVSGQGAVGFARTNEKGEYLLQTMNGRPDAGTLPGEYAVTITKYRSEPTGRRVPAPGSGEMVPEMRGVMVLPENYANAKNTPFSATVVKGENRFDFDIKSK